MSERRNIVIVGASFAGLLSTHYILKHILPALKAKNDAKYHVYLISPSTDLYFRVASPRTGASTALLPADKLFFSIQDALKGYSTDDLTFLQATATALDTTSRTLTYKRSEYLGDETLRYHALMITTGSRTHDPVYSQHTDKNAQLDAIKRMNAAAASAKSIILTGGGATGIESAGELGELLNGKPGWFSTPPRKVTIKLLTASNQLLPTLSPSIGKSAEKKLKNLGVDVVYNARVTDVREGKGNAKVLTLADGSILETDLYIPAHGVLPNNSFLPENLLTPSGYLSTNPSTLRVDAAGPRVYTFGDISSASRNNVPDLYDMMPAVFINLKRDLMFYSPEHANSPAPGKDRMFKPNGKLSMLVPIGSQGGVGSLAGWPAPSWLVWLVKGRDFMVSWGPQTVVNGSKVAKEFKWGEGEAVY